MSEGLELIFALGSTRPESVAAALLDALVGTELASDRYDLDGTQTPGKRVPGAIQNRGKAWFSVSNERMSANYNSLPRFEFDFLHVKTAEASFGPLAGDLVRKLCTAGEFVMAWLADDQYDYWQNTDDPLMYEIQNRDHSHLPKKPDGLPPPVGKMIIDTSNNPGLRILRKGYVEAVGGEMWLGDRFFALTGADSDALRKASGVQLGRSENAPYHSLSAEGGIFRSDQGETRAQQERLRALLYPKTRGAPRRASAGGHRALSQG